MADTAFISQRVEHTDPHQTMVHVDSQTCIEVLSGNGEYIVNRFRNGEGWSEIHRETTK